MNAEQLLQHFERISEAPDAIPRLRRFILDLAVRGKLVEQDPSDEPAAEQLERIISAKAALGRKQRSDKKKKVSNKFETLVDALPPGWASANLADLVTILNGRAYKQTELLDSGTPVLRVGNLFTSNKWYYSNLELEEDKYCNSGDLIYAWSASFGPFVWEGGRVIYHYHIWKLPLHSPVDLSRDYLYLYLLNKTEEIKDAGHGISMVHMTKEKMELLEVPLPPLAEQHRIVAKVDELMSLCDQLEAAKAEREQCRDSLVAASLQALNQPAEEEEAFREHARFTFNNLPRITTRSTHIKQLRQAILNLAVRGKLVPQDPSDEPAAELLKRIAAEKARLVKTGRIKRSAPALAITEKQSLFELPQGWVSVLWNSITLKIGDIDHKMPESVADGIPYISPRDFLPDNQIDFERAKRVSHQDFMRLSTKIKPDLGDIIYPRYGTIGENRLVEVQRDFLASYSCCVIKVLCGFVNPRYQYFFSISSHCRLQAKAAENKTTQSNVGIRRIQEFIVPLPPLAEQHRIVAKVDELMAICDQLEAQINVTEQDSRRFLEGVLTEALTPALVEAE